MSLQGKLLDLNILDGRSGDKAGWTAWELLLDAGIALYLEEGRPMSFSVRVGASYLRGRQPKRTGRRRPSMTDLQQQIKEGLRRLEQVGIVEYRDGRVSPAKAAA